MWKDIWDWIREMFSKKPKPDPNTEDLDLTTVKWLGDNYSGAQVEQLLNSASMNNNSISTSYKPYDWPSIIVKVRVDAICCIFYEKGNDIVGGKFDWWRAGGQDSKTLENLHNGYNGHIVPSAGSKVWTCIVSVDGKKRSNTISVSR